MAEATQNLPVRKNPHCPVTEERKRVFLDVLARTGIFTWAARAASPHSEGKRPGLSSFTDLVKRDPEFAAQVEEAKAEANALLEKTAYDRAVEGVPEPVFQKGIQAKDADGNPAFIRRYSDPLLLRLLERRQPNEWTPNRRIEHSGSIDHGASAGFATITAGDLECLSARQQQNLAEVLRAIKKHRGGESEVIDITPVEPVAALPADHPEMLALEEINS